MPVATPQQIKSEIETNSASLPYADKPEGEGSGKDLRSTGINLRVLKSLTQEPDSGKEQDGDLSISDLMDFLSKDTNFLALSIAQTDADDKVKNGAMFILQSVIPTQTVAKGTINALKKIFKSTAFKPIRKTMLVPRWRKLGWDRAPTTEEMNEAAAL